MPAERGHIAHFVSMNPNKRGPVELSLLATGTRWTELGGRFSTFFTAPPPDWYAEALQQAGIGFGVVRPDDWHDHVQDVCATTRPDLAHLHMARNTMAGELQRHGIRVVRTEHSGRPHTRTEPLRRPIRWARQRELDAIVCVSQHLARQTRRDFLAPPAKIHVIYNGVDTERFRPRPEEKAALRTRLLGLDEAAVVVTVAAHLTRQKRHHLLVEAMPSVLARVPHVHLVIAGDGPERQALHDRVASLGLRQRVHFLHQDNDVALLYSASDIGALTSIGEGLGGSAVEAQSSGLPLVATPDAGLAETFDHGVSGIPVEADPHSVADAIVRLGTDGHLRRHMGDRARDMVLRRFSMEKHVTATTALYDEILRRHPRR